MAKSSLQTVLEDAGEKGLTLINKRLCFKGLVEKDSSTSQSQQQNLNLSQQLLHQHSTSIGTVHLSPNHHHHNHSQQAINQSVMAQATGQAIVPLNINDQLNQESYFGNPLNVPNAYGFAWRRWSKTDAPTVKNKVGTIQVSHTMAKIDDQESREFQYILGAPTAAGSKLGSMTMTYLNQGQSYEIRLKKLKKILNEANLKTCVRLGEWIFFC